MNKLKQLVESSAYQIFMFSLVLGYCLTLIPSQDISNIFRFLLILGTLIAFIYEGKKILKDPVFILLGIALIIPIFSWLNAIHVIPDHVASGPKLDRLTRIFTFFLLAYWLKGQLSRIYWLWAVFILGFFSSCLLSPDFLTQVHLGMEGQRIDFGIKNAQFTSMFSGISLLISLFSYLLIYKSDLTIVKKSALYIIFSSTLVISAFITLASQSRQVWLALSVTVFLFPLLCSFIFKPKRLLALTYIGVIAIGLVLSQLPPIQHRVESESGTLHAVLNGQTIPMTSIGIRLNSWVEASHWIADNPIIGSTSESIPLVIQESNRFSDALKGQFGHLHNYYMEILVAYGFLGLILVLSLYYWVLRSLFIYKSKNQANFSLNIISVYACCMIIYWIIVNCFETYNSRNFGVFAQTLIFASIYTFYLTYKLKPKQSVK